MDWKERIIIGPNILVGKPVIKGTRLAVEFIVELLLKAGLKAKSFEITRGLPARTFQLA